MYICLYVYVHTHMYAHMQCIYCVICSLSVARRVSVCLFSDLPKIKNIESVYNFWLAFRNRLISST